MDPRNKIERLCKDAQILIDKGVRASDPDFQAWITRAHKYLIDIYGKNSYQYRKFRNISYILSSYNNWTPESEFIEACARGLQTAKAILEFYLEDMNDSVNCDRGKNLNEKDYSKVFIVHGHDGELKQKVARLIERQGLDAIILNEQTYTGKTIIEKLESIDNVAGVVCLFTADDEGKSKTEDILHKRARQNVIFETGYYIGQLGRNHIIIVCDDDIEVPSDMSGILYVNASDWQLRLLRELREMGYLIDMNRL